METKNTTLPLAKNTSGVAVVAIGALAVPWVAVGLLYFPILWFEY